MSDRQVSFLLKAASLISSKETNKSLQILKSHYLLRTKKITGPQYFMKNFSKEARCERCCIEWNPESESLVNPINLTRSQKKRIKLGKRKGKILVSKEYLLCSNELETICSFCGYSSKTAVVKPFKSPKFVTDDISCDRTINIEVTKKENIDKSKTKNIETNVYCKSKIAFCLKKQKNTLPNPNLSNITPKMIKNNKKKKDKLAGLCQTAVKAAAKLKQEKEYQNKINLFLKPSL